MKAHGEARKPYAETALGRHIALRGRQALTSPATSALRQSAPPLFVAIDEIQAARKSEQA